MDLRLGKGAVFFKDTFCMSKKKCTNGQTSMIHLSMDMEIPSRIDACCSFHEKKRIIDPAFFNSSLFTNILLKFVFLG